MRPKAISAELLLTALTPISHHDPAVQDGSNQLTFNRQKQLISAFAEVAAIDQPAADAFCQANPVPAGLADTVSGMSFTEYAAASIIKLMIKTYNSMDGVGLFSGLNRYGMLETRARTAAVKSSNLRAFWDALCRDMQLPIQPGSVDQELVRFFGLPGALQYAIVASIATDYRSIVTIARVWGQMEKVMDEDYAQKAGMLFDTNPAQTLRFEVGQIQAREGMVLDIPAVSSNSMRHQVVREPAWLHLFETLGVPRDGSLPVEAEAIFMNGGNIRAGAKQPSNSYQLARQVRDMYPVLDLLGGVCDAFDLGESMLSVASWLVCRENRAALSPAAASLPGAEVSAFDLLDDVTHTRQATENGVGQMIYNFETLVPGSQFVVRLALRPYTRDVTVGALASAVDTYLRTHPVIAGQSARGFGVVGAGWLAYPAEMETAQAVYEKYLEENCAALRDGIMDGMLTTGARVIS